MIYSTEQTAEQVVTLEDIERASERITALAQKTPVLRSRLFDRASGLATHFKCENLQRGGAFKIRGALNFLLCLSDEERRRGIVTFSSGNHAQAVAIAADYLGVKATIVMPTDTPKAKLEPTRAYAPEIVFFNRLQESREEIAARIAEETGATVVPSYDHPWIIAGQGTAALEFLRQQPELEALITPLGGGGLLSGSLIAANALRPGIRVFGAEPELADDWAQSLQKGERVEIAPPATIADGLRTTTPGAITFPIVRALAEGVLLVSEREIKATVRFLLSRLKILTEPSGAVAAAAVLDRKLPAGIGSIGVILSGGNVDWDVLAAICGEAD
ncbi:MAG: threonine/serine dehydratase [Acidobacteriaceae bacterium]|nr:threonine/serine dehydratase [Acidobacteriaceae bacterium]MBV8569387.1 threonine/serine dehydratase [Acidobacteriaceae bacterium]